MTDVHFLAPGLGRGAIGKRTLGLANLYLRGRRHAFAADDLVPRAIEDALPHRPELFCFSGDMTALSREEEFVRARKAFAPLLDAVPSVVVPGNHDVYTTGAAREERFARHFGGFGAPFPSLRVVGDVAVVATDPCRPSLSAVGEYPLGALAAAEGLVAEARRRRLAVVYLLHYPLVDPLGAPYTRRGHALLDREEVVASLRRAPPDLILHGHKHVAFRGCLPVPGGADVPILGCGSTSATTAAPASHAAGYFLVDLDAGGVRRVVRRCRQPDGSFARDERLSDPV